MGNEGLYVTVVVGVVALAAVLVMLNTQGSSYAALTGNAIVLTGDEVTTASYRFGNSAAAAGDPVSNPQTLSGIQLDDPRTRMVKSMPSREPMQKSASLKYTSCETMEDGAQEFQVDPRYGTKRASLIKTNHCEGTDRIVYLCADNHIIRERMMGGCN